jgi:hypothetical protein
MSKTHVIDGVTYVEVDRKAEVGDKVIIENGDGWYRSHVGEVFNVIDGKTYGFSVYGPENGDVYVATDGNYNGCCSFVSKGDYRVIVNAGENPLPDVTDLLANLARRVSSLEQQLSSTQANVEKLAEELANVKHQTQPKEVEVFTFEKFLDSIADKVAERLVGR